MPITYTPPPKTVTPPPAGGGSWIGVAYLVLVSLIIMLFIAIIIVKHRRNGGVSKCDLYALVVDETSNTISLECLEKLHGDTYIKYGGDEPLMVAVPKNTHTYKLKIGDKTYDNGVIAYSYHGIMLPLDAKLIGSLSLLMSTNEYARLDEDELSKLLAEMHRLSDSVTGHVVISPSYRIAFAFNVRKAIRDTIEKLLYSAGESVQHLFSTMRKTSGFKEFIESLTKYHEVKMGKWKYIITLIIVVGVIAVLLMSLPHH